MLHRRRRANFERPGRMLFQKRRLIGGKSAFSRKLGADDVLEISFFRFGG
jgi:hypothetical protein